MDNKEKIGWGSWFNSQARREGETWDDFRLRVKKACSKRLEEAGLQPGMKVALQVIGGKRTRTFTGHVKSVSTVVKSRIDYAFVTLQQPNSIKIISANEIDEIDILEQGVILRETGNEHHG